MSFKKKIERIRTGGSPRVLDLFAGCGGISLGFHGAGFEIIGAVEFDKAAAKSHAINFHRHLPDDLRSVHEKHRDITEIEPHDLMQEYGLSGSAASHVDVIVGGPPCQAFARVGRAKLREVAEHPEAFLKDPRGNLYLRYLHYVQKLKPLAVLMENVPDVLNYGGHNVAEETCEVLESWGYHSRYTMLNAVFYGVPEMRERMFLVAYRKELRADKWFPDPTHWINLPKGYHGSRQVALKTIKTSLLEENRFFIDPPEPHPDHSTPAVTAQEALSDLPVIPEDSIQKRSKSPRRFNEKVIYPNGIKLNKYQKQMREWPGFKAGNGVFDHVIRYLPRDYKIFARMKPGDQYPEAHALAMRMLEEQLELIEKSEGKRPTKASARYNRLIQEFVPPYDPSKFPNKWRKMEPDQPARTLMAHLGKDSYSHIHYDDVQARTISVREAARLQSFPDGFIFQGPMNPAFRQIGNAVPPLLAKELATTMMEQITKAWVHEEKTCAKEAVGL